MEVVNSNSSVVCMDASKIQWNLYHPASIGNKKAFICMQCSISRLLRYRGQIIKYGKLMVGSQVLAS